MSVTSKKRKEDPLNLYVDFLNVNLSTDPRPKLRKGQKLKDFLNQFECEPVSCKINLLTGEVTPRPPNPNWLEEAKDLQGEMRNDLFPIAARKEIPEKLFPLLERWVYLTEKLNEMNFIRRWNPHFDRKGQMRIRGWNFKPDYNQRDIWYLGLAERLEDGDLERLRLCPICSKYFSARDKRQRFCGTQCKREYDNKDSKFRVKRYRSKQKKDNKRNIKHEQRIEKFIKFLNFAVSHPQDTKTVGPMVLKIGQGDGTEGWRRIEQYVDELKNGVDPRQVFNNLPEEIKDYFRE